MLAPFLMTEMPTAFIVLEFAFYFKSECIEIQKLLRYTVLNYV